MWHATHANNANTLRNRTNIHTYSLSMCPTQLSWAYTSTARFLWSIKLNIFGKTLWMCRHCASILFECNIIRLYLICSLVAFFFLCSLVRSLCHTNDVEMEMKKQMRRGKCDAEWEEEREKITKIASFYNSFIGFISPKRNFPSSSDIFYVWLFFSRSFRFVCSFFISIFAVLLVSMLYVMLLSQFDIFTLSAHWILLHWIANAR